VFTAFRAHLVSCRRNQWLSAGIYVGSAGEGFVSTRSFQTLLLTRRRRYWLSPTGERLDYDPNAHKYSWVENWSEEHKRPFYYNQKTKESAWCANIP